MRFINRKGFWINKLKNLGLISKKFGAEIIQDATVNIEKKQDGFEIQTEQNGNYTAKHVLLATGVSLDLAEKAGIFTKEGTEPRIKTVFQVDGSGKTNVEGAQVLVFIPLSRPAMERK